MIKIVSTEQCRKADAYTIKHEPISSIDLMERASSVFSNYIKKKISLQNKVLICCGQGNNGGDGLAIARILHKAGYYIEVLILKLKESGSRDYEMNLKRIENLSIPINFFEGSYDITQYGLIIDALWGSGLSRPIEGPGKDLINSINLANIQVYSVDIPSGLHADRNINSTCIEAHYCLSFEFPKKAFFLAENHKYVKDWHHESIGLNKIFIDSIKTDYFLIESNDIKRLFKKRERFGHKGSYGHACIIAGQIGMSGACILSCTAALRGGLGLLSAYVPKVVREDLQNSLPEIMILQDPNKTCLSKFNPKLKKYNQIAIGPGIGQSKKTEGFLSDFLKNINSSLIIDADAINILSKNKSLLNRIGKNCILTPHPGEFKRLVGEWRDDHEKLDLQKAFCKEYECYMILKGAYSSVCTPLGNTYFNPSGNPGMATAGSGDVLTGLLIALLAQGYSMLDTCLMGTYLHGKAGDLALEKQSHESLIASDIINYFGKSFKSLL